MGQFVVFDPSSASGEVADKAGVSVFPNPILGGQFWVKNEAGELVSAQLFDVLGREVFSKKLDGGLAECRASGLPPGVYLLKINTLHGQTTQQLILGD